MFYSSKMGSGDVDLRRQAMFTTKQQNTVEFDIILQDNAKKSDHETYIRDILRNTTSWEPEKVFKINWWIKRIKRVASQNKEDEKFWDKSVLYSFAEVMLQFVCDHKKPYFNQISKKMDNDQSKRLVILKNAYEEKEVFRLLEEAHSGSLSCSPKRDDGKSSEDDDDDNDAFRQSPWKRAPAMNVNNSKEPVVSKCIKEEISSPVRLFQQIDFNNLSAEPEKKKRELQQSCKRTPVISKNIKRRNSSERPTAFVTDSGNKKQRRGSFNGHPLGVIITPKKPKMASPSETFPYSNIRHDRPICQKNLSDDFINSIEEDNPANNSFFENSVQYPSYDDEVIENPTPPCSPACTAVIERSEISVGASIGENLENVAPNENSADSTNSKSVQTKDSPCSSKIQRLKVGENRTASAENRKIKGIAPRLNSQASYSAPPTSTVTSNVNINDEDPFDLPDINPPIDQDKENYPNNIDEIAIKYPKPPSAPALTLDMFEELKRALERPPKDRVVSGFSFNILQEDLALFSKDTEWLIDMNIDFYLELIKERSLRPGYPSVYIFHSFFYTLLTDKDAGYHVVEETTGEDDIFKYDLVLFPVNLSQHWRLVVVQFPLKTMLCYDSMPHDNADVLKNIGSYLRAEYRRKYRKDFSSHCNNSSSEDDTSCTRTVLGLDKPEPKTTRMFFESWFVENVSSESIPQQKNAIDCGVFVLQYAEYLSRNAAFDFDQTHIPYFRKRMMYETLTKTLLTAMPVSENITKS